MFLLISVNGADKVVKNIPFSGEAFNVFFQSLGVMWKSMTGIFGVLLVFYIVIRILGRMRDTNE